MATYTIESPMPGVFYRRPDPDDPEFFNEGDQIEEGDTVAMVGVMKNFNDITADRGGTIKEFLVENETEIKAGEELVVIEHE